MVCAHVQVYAGVAVGRGRKNLDHRDNYLRGVGYDQGMIRV